MRKTNRRVEKLLEQFPQLLELSPNTGTLKDYCCPACGYRAGFRIDVVKTVMVDDGGIDGEASQCDTEWDMLNDCSCRQCGWAKRVCYFVFRGLDDLITRHQRQQAS